MGVIETEYLEIREITKGILSGAIKPEIGALALKGYSESGKRVDQYLKVISLTINHGKSARQIIAKNIISEGTAIDMNSPTIEEKVKCAAMGDTLVSRTDCLDFSGDEKRILGCQKCEHFATTRKQIFP